MRCSKTCFAVVLALYTAAALVRTAAADPFPGQELKFLQAPMTGITITNPDGTTGDYFGHDELSTAYATIGAGGVITGYTGTSMADDFADNFDTPVVHVTWWGSYLNLNPDHRLDQFLIAFEEDVPAGVAGPDGTVLPYSRPGNVLSTEIVDLAAAMTPGVGGDYTEDQITFGLPEDIYKYNAELALPFAQQKDEIYWLKIVGLVDGQAADPSLDTKWGWHNRDYTVSNPLASPVPVPGEFDERPITDPAYPTEVWHFQDDVVESEVTITLNSLVPNVPLVVQTDPIETFYVDGLDGPGPVPVPPGGHGGISQFSKDLAFALYTVPEPSSVMLIMIGLVGLTGFRRPHSPSS